MKRGFVLGVIIILSLVILSSVSSVVSAVPLNQYFESDGWQGSLFSTRGSNNINCALPANKGVAICEGTCPTFCAEIIESYRPYYSYKTKYPNAKACEGCAKNNLDQYYFCKQLSEKGSKICEGSCPDYCADKDSKGKPKYPNAGACIGCANSAVDCSEVANKAKDACRGTCPSYCSQERYANAEACLKCNPSYCLNVNYKNDRACEQTCQAYCNQKANANSDACTGCGMYVDCDDVSNKGKDACEGTCPSYCSQNANRNAKACIGCFPEIKQTITPAPSTPTPIQPSTPTTPTPTTPTPTTPTQPSQPAAFCTDSDGANYLERGTCNDNSGSYQDSCLNTNSLQEYNCVNNKCTATTLSSCSSQGSGFVCTSGICVKHSTNTGNSGSQQTTPTTPTQPSEPETPSPEEPIEEEAPLLCSECGSGLTNICDEDECSNIPQGCFFNDKGIGGRCDDCTGKVCGDYKTEDHCYSDSCLGDCGWDIEEEKCGSINDSLSEEDDNVDIEISMTQVLGSEEEGYVGEEVGYSIRMLGEGRFYTKQKITTYNCSRIFNDEDSSPFYKGTLNITRLKYNEGVKTYRYEEMRDECIDNVRIRHYECFKSSSSSLSQSYQTTYICPFGCSEGSCNEKPYDEFANDFDSRIGSEKVININLFGDTFTGSHAWTHYYKNYNGKTFNYKIFDRWIRDIDYLNPALKEGFYGDRSYNSGKSYTYPTSSDIKKQVYTAGAIITKNNKKIVKINADECVGNPQELEVNGQVVKIYPQIKEHYIGLKKLLKRVDSIAKEDSILFETSELGDGFCIEQPIRLYYLDENDAIKYEEVMSARWISKETTQIEVKPEEPIPASLMEKYSKKVKLVDEKGRPMANVTFKLVPYGNPGAKVANDVYRDETKDSEFCIRETNVCGLNIPWVRTDEQGVANFDFLPPMGYMSSIIYWEGEIYKFDYSAKTGNPPKHFYLNINKKENVQRIKAHLYKHQLYDKKILVSYIDTNSGSNTKIPISGIKFELRLNNPLDNRVISIGVSDEEGKVKMILNSDYLDHGEFNLTVYNKDGEILESVREMWDLKGFSWKFVNDKATYFYLVVEQKAEPQLCAECGTGITNICDLDECSNIPQGCFFNNKIIGDKCIQCDSVSCNDYNAKEDCSQDTCSLNCLWDEINGKCANPEDINAQIPETPLPDECESSGFFCLIPSQCSETNILPNEDYFCNSASDVCCKKDYVEPTCLSKGGIICASGKQCDIDVVSAKDTDKCCIGSCVDINTDSSGGSSTPTIPETPSPIQEICSDSDEGVNYETKGDVYISSKLNSSDYCDNAIALVEYSCSQDNVKTNHYKCPNGCLAGACLKTINDNSGEDDTPTCSEKEGVICSSEKECDIDVVSAKDTDKCCIGTCCPSFCKELKDDGRLKYGYTSRCLGCGGDLCENSLYYDTLLCGGDKNPPVSSPIQPTQPTTPTTPSEPTTPTTPTTPAQPSEPTQPNTGGSGSQPPTPSPDYPDSCFDDDGGINITKRGKVSTGDLSFKDNCINSDAKELSSCSGNDCYIAEYFCSQDSWSLNYISCEEGCNQGVCGELSEIEIICNDSDGGLNYFVRGENFGIYNDPLTNEERNENVRDACIGDPETSQSDIDYYLERGFISESQAKNDNILMEYFCKDNKIELKAYECPNGCQNGACIPEDVPECTLNTDCGSGYICENEKCIERKNTEDGIYCGDGICGGSMQVSLRDGDVNIKPAFLTNPSISQSRIKFGTTLNNAQHNVDIKVYTGTTKMIDININGDTLLLGFTGTNNQYVIGGLIVKVDSIGESNGAPFFSLTLGENSKTCSEDCSFSECTDNDGGLDYYTKGLTKGMEKTIVSGSEVSNYAEKEDICVKDNQIPNPGLEEGIFEYYCNGDVLDVKDGLDETYVCPNGCDDGACISASADVTAPKIISSGYLSKDSDFRLNIETDEIAVCKYSYDDIAFVEMTNTGSTQHSQMFFLPAGLHNIYVRCEDNVGNVNLHSSKIDIEVFPEEDSNCYNNGGECTSTIRGCGQYKELDSPCPGGVGLTCCEEIPYCGDGVCFTHEFKDYEENSINCPKDCGVDEEVDRCSELDVKIIAKLTNLKNEGGNVVIKEGEKIYDNQYFVVSGFEGGKILLFRGLILGGTAKFMVEDIAGEKPIEVSLQSDGDKYSGKLYIGDEYYNIIAYYGERDYIIISDGVKGISSYNCAIENSHPYMVLQNFGSLEPNLESLEEGIDADAVDVMADVFPDFLNGAFMTHDVVNEDRGILLAIAEYKDAISFKQFERNFVKDILLEQGFNVNLDYDSVPEGLGVEGAQVLFAGEAGDDGDYGVYWISQNKFIVFYVENSNDWDIDSTESIEKLLEAYLIKHPSTLVKDSELEYCGDDICAGSENAVIMLGETELGPYNGQIYGISVESVDVSGKDKATLNINGVNHVIFEGQNYYIGGLYFYVEDIIQNQFAGDYPSQVKLIIGEDEKSCSADCGFESVYAPVIQRDIGDLRYIGMENDDYCEILSGDDCNLWVAQYEYGYGVDDIIAAVEIHDNLFTNEEFINSMTSFSERKGYGNIETEINNGINPMIIMEKKNEQNPEITSYILTWYNNNKIIGILIENWDTASVDDDIFEDLLNVYLNKYPSDLEIEGEAPNPEIPNIPCVDSDDGKDIYTKGKTSGLEMGTNKEVYMIDFCESEGEKAGRLIEYSCSMSGGVYMVRSESFGPEDGCDKCINGKCIDAEEKTDCPQIGLRKEEQYCDFGYEWHNQRNQGTCENNFECVSNYCLDSECIEAGVLDEFMKWLKGLLI